MGHCSELPHLPVLPLMLITAPHPWCPRSTVSTFVALTDEFGPLPLLGISPELALCRSPYLHT